MLEKMFLKETDHEYDTCKIFGIFFMGMKHPIKQVRSKLLTSFAKIGNAKLGVA
jgi:hypothetical protein